MNDFRDLDRLFDEIHPDLLKRAQCWLPGRGNELVNETYLKLRNYWPHKKHNEHLRGLAYRTMATVRIDMLRATKPTPADRDPDDIETPEPEENSMLVNLGRKYLDDAIESLSEPARTIAKAYRDGLKPREMSIAGLSPVQISRIQNASMSKLKKYILRETRRERRLLQ